LIKIIIKEEKFKWHLEAFASELFIYKKVKMVALLGNQPYERQCCVIEEFS